jgi:hypothetical protein
MIKCQKHKGQNTARYNIIILYKNEQVSETEFVICFRDVVIGAMWSFLADYSRSTHIGQRLLFLSRIPLLYFTCIYYYYLLKTQ